MKASLAPGVRKSIPELAFAKSDFLDLVSFGFLDLADFTAINRFSKLPPTPLLPAPPAAPSPSWFSAWVF